MKNFNHIEVTISIGNQFEVVFNNKNTNLFKDVSNIEPLYGYFSKVINNNPFINTYKLKFDTYLEEELSIEIPSSNKLMTINGHYIPETLLKTIKEISNSVLDYLLANKNSVSTSPNNKEIKCSLNTKLGKFSTTSTNYKGIWIQPLINKKYKKKYTSISVSFHDTKYPFHIIIQTDYSTYATIYYKREKIMVITKNVPYNNIDMIQHLLPVIYDLYNYHESWYEHPNLGEVTSMKKEIEDTTRRCVKIHTKMFLAARPSKNIIDWSNIIPVSKDSKYLFKENKDVYFKKVDELKETWSEAYNTKLKKSRKFKLPKPTGKKVGKILTLKP